MSPDTKKKVLHVIPGFGWKGTFGGAERTVYNLVRGLSRSGTYAPVLCVLRPPHPPEGVPLDGCEILTLEYEGPDRDFEMLARCAIPLRAAIKRLRPDIVHSHLWPAAAVAGCALKGLPTPHVVHIHDTRPWLVSRQLRHRARRVLNRFALGPSARFIACAESVRAYTASGFLPSVHIEVIHYGIDTQRPFRKSDHSAAPDGVTLIGTAARLRPEKGIEQLIAACKRLRDEGGRFRLMIAGGGTLLPHYQDMARRAGLADHVEFLGAVADIPSFLAELNVFVLPSVATEGLPISLLEAMALRLPVVASAIAGIPEAVTDGQEGFLVPPDDTEALCAALKKLVADPALAIRMGEMARARVDRAFTVERLVDQVARCYETILAHAPTQEGNNS